MPLFIELVIVLIVIGLLLYLVESVLPSGTLKIRDGASETSGVVAKLTEAIVTEVAKQTAYPSSRVVVVDPQLCFSLADRAKKILSFKLGVVLVKRQPMVSERKSKLLVPRILDAVVRFGPGARYSAPFWMRRIVTGLNHLRFSLAPFGVFGAFP